MIVYQDRMFCTRGEDCTCPPHVKLTDEVVAAARRAGLPISCGDRCQGDGLTPRKIAKLRGDRAATPGSGT